MLPLHTNEDELRLKVVKEAKTWRGTPYGWLMDKKSKGVDCAMLLVRVYVDTGVVPPFDPRPYQPLHHLHREEEHYLKWLATFGVEKPLADLKLADVIVWRFGRCYSHSGIYIGQGEIIHAVAEQGMCTRGRLVDTQLAIRPCKVFDIWGSK